jgi:hypothetical protein
VQNIAAGAELAFFVSRYYGAGGESKIPKNSWLTVMSGKTFRFQIVDVMAIYRHEIRRSGVEFSSASLQHKIVRSQGDLIACVRAWAFLGFGVLRSFSCSRFLDLS